MILSKFHSRFFRKMMVALSYGSDGSARASDIGDLACLPPEVRLMLYEQCAAVWSVSLLGANRQIYHEMISYVREKMKLCFVIDPTETGRRIPFYSSADGERRHLCVNWPAPSPSHFHLGNPITAAPMHMFKALTITIRAPNPEDPGQLINAWQKLMALLDCLLPLCETDADFPCNAMDLSMRAKRHSWDLPSLEIRFENSQNGHWERLGRWQDSVTPAFPLNLFDLHACCTKDNTRSDVFFLMTALVRLRCAASATVILPTSHETISDGHGRCVTEDLQEIADGMISDEPMGFMGGDDKRQQFIDHCCLWTEIVLDTAKGPTAAILRRERFASWCNQYPWQLAEWSNGSLVDADEDLEKRLEIGHRDLHSPGDVRFGGVDRLIDPGEELLIDEGLAERYRALYAFNLHMNPPQVKMGRAKGNWELAAAAYGTAEGDARHLCKKLGFVRAPPQQWEESFPDGIPPRGSGEYHQMIRKTWNIPGEVDVLDIDAWPAWLRPVVFECEGCGTGPLEIRQRAEPGSSCRS